MWNGLSDRFAGNRWCEPLAREAARRKDFRFHPNFPVFGLQEEIGSVLAGLANVRRQYPVAIRRKVSIQQCFPNDCENIVDVRTSDAGPYVAGDKTAIEITGQKVAPVVSEPFPNRGAVPLQIAIEHSDPRMVSVTPKSIVPREPKSRDAIGPKPTPFTGAAKTAKHPGKGRSGTRVRGAFFARLPRTRRRFP